MAAPSSVCTDEVELSIVMPCLDEAETVATCVRKAVDSLHRLGVRGEVVVADNGSTDGSPALASAAGARVVEVSARGYGAALTAGIAASRGTFVIMGDADDSYDFSELEPFVDGLRSGADIVVGNRFVGGIAAGAMPVLHRYVGNPTLSLIAKRLFATGVGDVYCGLRGFRRRAVLDLDLRSTGMEFAIEMIVKASLHGLQVSEVPTTLRPDGRTRAPHLRTWRDGWRSLRFLLLYSPRWLFFYPGLLTLLLASAGIVAAVVARWSIEVELLLGAVALTGAQSVLFAAFAKVFAISEGLLPPDGRTLRLLRTVTLEVGLVVAGATLVLGVAVVVAGMASTEELDHRVRMIIPGGILVTLGFQGVLASFFLSMLGLSRRGSPVVAS